MARQRQFIDTNVYEESKKRIHHIFDTHDHVNVAFCQLQTSVLGHGRPRIALGVSHRLQVRRVIRRAGAETIQALHHLCAATIGIQISHIAHGQPPAH